MVGVFRMSTASAELDPALLWVVFGAEPCERCGTDIAHVRVEGTEVFVWVEIVVGEDSVQHTPERCCVVREAHCG